MAWKRLSWQACKGGVRACLTVTHALLLLLALIQAAAIASIHLVGTISLPDFAVDLLRRRFAEQGVALDWDTAEFDLTGQVRVEGLRCSESATGNPILSAALVRLDIDLSGTLGRFRFSPESLYLRDAALFLPPEVATDGGISASLRIGELDTRYRWKRLELRSCFLQAGETRVQVEGLVPLDFDLGAAPADRGETTAARRWRQASLRVAPYLAALRGLPPAAAHLTLSLDTDGQWFAQAEATLPAFDGDHLSAREIHLECPAINLSHRSIDRPTQVRVKSLASDAGEGPVLERITATLRGAPLTHASGWRLPGSLWVYAHPHYKDLPLESLHLQTALGPLPGKLVGDARIVFAGGRLAGTVALDLATRAGSTDFTWRGDPDLLLQSQALAGGAIGEETRFSPFTTIEGRVVFGPDEHSPHGTLRVHAIGSGVREAEFDEALMSAWFTPSDLQVGPIQAFDPGGQWAEGYYLQDLSTGDYRIVAEGEVFPRRLDSLLPRFYRGLWDEIDPGSEPVHADVDVLSRWGAPDSTHSLVHARGRNLAYLGQPVERLFLHLWQATGFVEIMRLETRSSEGTLEGSIGLTFPPAETPDTPRLRILDLRTRLGLDTLAVVFGEEMKEAAQHLHFSQPPLLEITGTVTQFPEEGSTKALRVRATAEDPWTLDAVPFDRLFADLALGGSTVTAQPIVLSVGEGRWEMAGTVDLAAEPNPTFTVNTTLERVPYATIRHLLETWTPEEPAADGASDAGDKAAQETPATEEAPHPMPGWINLDLAVTCPGELWSTMQGSGTLEIGEADLGRIYLLGGLSRAFAAIKLNLATFRLDQLESTLALEAGRLDLPDLTIRGPALRLDSPGAILFPSQTLDFKTKVFFLDTKDPSLLGIFGPLLRPFGYLLELRVGGTLEEPDWRLVNNPFNLLRPRPAETTPAPPPATSEAVSPPSEPATSEAADPTTAETEEPTP